MAVFGSRGFKGSTAHPNLLRWLGLFGILFSIGCIGVGIANTATKLMANPDSNPLTKASVAIWTPVPMFFVGIMATNVAGAINASKRWAGMLAFISSFMLSPVLIGITSVEVMMNKMVSLDNSIPIAILVLGSLLFLTMFFIAMILYFCTYAEDETPLVQEPIQPPAVFTTVGHFNPPYTGYTNPPNTGYTNPPNTGYKPMPLTPSYVLPTAQTFTTNMPYGYSGKSFQSY